MNERWSEFWRDRAIKGNLRGVQYTGGLAITYHAMALSLQCTVSQGAKAFHALGSETCDVASVGLLVG